MSLIDDLYSASEALWRSSQTGLAGLQALPAGKDGFEDDVGIPENLAEATQLPHVFAHDSVALVDPLPNNQFESTIRIRHDLVPLKAETRQNVDTRLQAYRAAVAADPTLGGTVKRAWVSAYSTVDSKKMEGSEFRLGRAVLSVVVQE